MSYLLESLLGDVDDVDLSCRNDQQYCYNSSTLDYLSSENRIGTRWAEWDEFVDHAGTQSDVTVRKKRKPADGEASPGNGSELQTREQRQRGKNWEKAEEDVLVECRSQHIDWKCISERLQEHGYTRNHKHCADKWYALRKHYLEVRKTI